MPPSVRKLIITASGGPFREWDAQRLDNATPDEALNHPTWSMGPKNTIDSASLMNKALELIEAHWLFDAPSEMLDVHGMRDFVLELDPVADVGEVLAAQRVVRSVHGSEALRRYVVSIAAATREHPEVDVGASPRASLMLFRAAKAMAALRGRDHVLPDDVQELAPAVLAHRLILGPGTNDSDRARVVGEAVEKLPAL